jgi:formate hydrogenlyase subunit 6/NADH:ubiquinone oxidoreductase subunit I
LGFLSSLKGAWVATWAGVRHAFKPRMTLRYPEQKLDLQGPGYHFDPRNGVGLPGFKGRHLLREDKCTGCQLCAIACDGVAVAIEMQTMVRNKPQNKKNYWPAVDYGRCVPPWTPVVTSRGIVPISEIVAGDRVLTHTGNFRLVNEVFRRKHTGKVYTFKVLGNDEPLTVTEGHPILVETNDGPKWKMPDEIKYRDYLTRPIIVDEQPMDKVEYQYDLYHPAGRGGYVTRETHVLQFTPELARLVGYYLSEGHADAYRVSFDINKSEEPTLAADIVSCMRSVFEREYVSFKPDMRSEGLKLVVDSVEIATFFRQFGAVCDKKQLPPWSLSLQPQLQAQIIKAAYLGDGHYSNKRYRYRTAMHSNYFVIRTTSRILATQYMHILHRLGIIASVSVNNQKDRKTCYSVTVHTPFIEKMSELTGVKAESSPPHSHSYLRMAHNMVLSPVVKIEVQNVRDFEVYNLEVDTDNTYVASNQIVHNCVFCALCVDACPFDALSMTNDYELSAYDKASLKYTPDMLMVHPEEYGTTEVKFDRKRGNVTHG